MRGRNRYAIYARYSSREQDGPPLIRPKSRNAGRSSRRSTRKWRTDDRRRASPEPRTAKAALLDSTGWSTNSSHLHGGRRQ